MKQQAQIAAPVVCLLVCLAWIGLDAAAPTELRAQTDPTGGPLPQEVRQEVISFLNDPNTLRVAGGTRIPAATRVDGPLGVLGGELRVAGTIAGPVVVVNGDLRIASGGRIEGPVLVVGGRIHEEATSVITGQARHYSAPLRFRIRGDRVEDDDPRTRELPPILELDLGFAILRPTIRSAGNYNRTEGLPVHFGPLIRSGGRNPTELKVFGLWRSASGLELDSDNLGHLVQVEQELGGSGEGRVGFAFHSSIRPIESRGLSDPEASFATFLLHRDFRDYYQAEGWSTYLELNPLDRPFRARIEYTEEDHAFAPIRNPWTIRSDEAAWRPQPLVAEGALRSLSLAATLDTRDDVRDPTVGWWVEGMVRRRVGGDLRVPEFTLVDDASTLAEATVRTFPLSTDASLDLRAYNRLGPDTRLNFRFQLAGSVDGDALPPQFQRALGGEGSLPGHRRFSVDCGARVALVSANGEDEAFPAYGCDRIGLFQMELRRYLPFSWSFDPDRHPDWDTGTRFEIRPAWVLFGGVGRGQALNSVDAPDFRVDSATRADVGMGLVFGPAGVYWAYPLNHRDRGLNFFIRLDHRF